MAAAAMLFTRALLLMWREQFDIFWDGRRRLALGWFDGAWRDAEFAAAGIAAGEDLLHVLATSSKS